MRGLGNDRAVSDVVGFVLVFSLVVGSVTLVSVVGVQSLEDTRNFEETNNAERAFDVLADNLADIYKQGAPSRATEISLQEANLEVGNPVSINITGVNTSLTPPVSSNVFSYNPIVFQGRSGSKVVYSAGGVFRDPEQGGVLVVEPPISIQSDQVLFTIVQTNHFGDITSTGGGTVRVRAVKQQRQPLRGFATSDFGFNRLIVNITSPRSSIWAEYLSSKPSTTCVEPKPDNVRCEIQISGNEDVYISRVLIGYEFES